MKKLVLLVGILSIISIGTFIACEKADNPTTTEMLSKKGGNGNGNGGNSGGGTVGTTTNTNYFDSLYNACGMRLTDTGSTYPTVIVNNINPYLRNLPSSDSTYYSQLVIRFDVPVIPGKTISSYVLFADQCSGRPACSKMNGLYLSQVTAGVPYNAFYISIGTSWLNPYAASYTGVICAVTTEGCMYLSQPFTFFPPRIL